MKTAIKEINGEMDGYQLELIEGLGVDGKGLAEGELKDVEEFYAISKQEGGLILQAIAPELLQVSRARLNQLIMKYENTSYFKQWSFFGKNWFSRKQLEAFSRINRSSGRGRPSLAKIIEQTKEELL